MAIKNNYWKTELGKKDKFYTAWPGGWEIHIRKETNKNWRTGKEHTTMIVDMPYRIPVATKKDFRLRLARDKRIAQSVTTKQEYHDLWKRIDNEDWEYIEKNDLRDEALVYWAHNTRTSDELYRLLRYN
jgi:hypothetical protein